MRIAIYSGSFNPLHIGHLAVLEEVDRCGKFDWTYLVVSPKNPLKDSARAETGRDRLRAAIQAVSRHPQLRVWVDDIELDMPAPQYTIFTLDALAAREPENTYTLIIGGDSLADFRRWRSYERILRDYGVAVYPRSGFDTEALRSSLLAEDPTYKIDILDAPRVDISSTEIREALEAGRDIQSWLM